ncbi:hypothetical protein BD626DRAFT_549885 [Schizophyllum amplum]|uniref:Glycoside hydrolase family 43 protein n=1 Tax=Schizophyllum amplum TaxID=97359 RepID=A0A550C661_9AGAR|nr:hypothetical protein BD626DRAFT_549885 [Auriculariopsis ampla]
MRRNLLSLLGAAGVAHAQLGLGNGTLDFTTPAFTVSLVRDSQTLYSLVNSAGFDYVPGDVMANRSSNGQYHLGDITFRARLEGASAWTEGDSAAARAPVAVIPGDADTLAAANLSPTLGGDPILNITRRWVQDGDGIKLLFDVVNSQDSAVEIGALGAPLEFNNIVTDRPAAEANTVCSFFDPYIGADAGYVQVTPLSGTDAPLVVIPVVSSPLEGWRFLPETPLLGPTTSLYEWQFHTLAYAENEWANVDPWNAPTSVTLQPGESRTYGLRFVTADSIRTINDALAAGDHPVLEGIPGYVISADATAKLFVRYASPVAGISVEPAGALSWEANDDATDDSYVGYDLTVSGWGRARLEITFEDGTLATVSYYLRKPNADEVAKLEQFVDETVWGLIQNEDFTVKKSIFFYEPGAVDYSYPSSVDWGVWWSWNKADSYNVQRAYDYVHVAGLYWALYRVARNYPDLVTVQSADWYLSQAASTIIRMSAGIAYADLQREGHANATAVESAMADRHSIWAGERYPTTTTNTINSILGYQPSVPHWGYNGNARRYWDNIYGGKLQRVERQIHHYGSSLNALPLMSAYESDPSDYWLLRTGFGGLSGALSSINEAGFPAASFHSFADTLKWDGYTGDYGQSFSGHAMGMGTYILEHPAFGWQAYGGVVTSRGSTIEVDVLDSSRRRVYVAPLGAVFTADAGSFASVSFDPSALSVTLTLVDAVGNVGVTQTASVGGVGSLAPTGDVTEDGGAYLVEFSGTTASITFA